MVYLLILVRHGESTWNADNRFTGWTDVELSDKGVLEADAAGLSMKERSMEFDIVYTSVLRRAVHTTWAIMKKLEQSHIPVINTWRLNERHYGELQGLNKSETAAKHGEDQVKIWRRSYDVAPPPLEKSDARWPGNSSVYKYVPQDFLPVAECLKDTVDRVLPFWADHIAPAILSGKRVLVSAHGNSLRALVKHLDNLSDAEIMELNIPTGVPLAYELDSQLKPIRHYYLASDDEVNEKMMAVANQGKAK